MWLDRKLTFKKHTEMKCAAATRAFHLIHRLNNISKGLSFQAIRQLYISCVKAIGAYKVSYWWNHNYARINGFEKLQNSALKTILGQFRTALIVSMEIEAAIPPIRIQFDRITKFYGVRVLKLQSSHPVRALIGFPRQRREPTYVKTKNLKASKNRTQLESIMRSVEANKGYYKLERFKFVKDLP
jgi:hypothetical protein